MADGSAPCQERRRAIPYYNHGEQYAATWSRSSDSGYLGRTVTGSFHVRLPYFSSSV
jgi:hypothetical protein